MEVKANKSVRFDSDTDLKFSKLSEKLGRSKQELFGQMVDYFYKSKKDPADLNDELLKKELGQGINRIISFIKTQEKEALSPMLADLAQLQRTLSQLSHQQGRFFQVNEEQNVDGFFAVTQRRQMREHQDVLKQQQEMAQMLQNLLSETRSHQNEVKTQLKAKQSLKAKFTAILNHYILHREQMNAITQGRLIKELQENSYSQVTNL
ncbi:BfmA/BtgA family mobilization protein [Spirosoma panaciterrae]|uniref:BfmA/BtgA family mobilization protein n=1 Tax=Spirosoma panaciterrae TaxID=496058 RepID=UPI00036A11F7|nr:BfmA/BtgA family mobilization protein [Spirosoma panaciterrae]